MSFSKWKKYQLGDLVTFQRGHDLAKSEFIEGKFPIAGSNGIIGYHHRFTTNAPSLTIGRSGNLGTAHFYKDNFWAHNTTLYAKEFYNSDPKFIYYLIQTLDLKQFNSGSAVPSLNRNYIHPIEVIAPDLKTQQRIASILSSLDDAIELNLQINKTLEELAKALFKEWFVDFNFPNVTGAFQETEIGKIPVGWKVGNISEICYIQNGYAFKSKDFKKTGEIGIIKIKNINGNLVDVVNTDFVGNETIDFLDKKFNIESGSLLIAMTGAEVGKIGLVPNTEKDLWLNQRVGKFIEKVKFANHFLYLLLSSNEYQNVLLNTASGSAQPNISASQIESITVILPDKGLIENFGELINPFFDQILQNEKENQSLSNLRETLLPKLMKGEIQI